MHQWLLPKNIGLQKKDEHNTRLKKDVVKIMQSIPLVNKFT